MCSFPFCFYFQPPLVLGLNNFLLKNHGNYNVRVNLPPPQSSNYMYTIHYDNMHIHTRRHADHAHHHKTRIYTHTEMHTHLASHLAYSVLQHLPTNDDNRISTPYTAPTHRTPALPCRVRTTSSHRRRPGHRCPSPARIQLSPRRPSVRPAAAACSTPPPAAA